MKQEEEEGERERRRKNKKIAERKVERRNLPKAWEEREANRNVEQSDVVG